MHNKSKLNFVGLRPCKPENSVDLIKIEGKKKQVHFKNAL